GPEIRRKVAAGLGSVECDQRSQYRIALIHRAAQDHSAVDIYGTELISYIVDFVDLDAGELPLRTPAAGRPDALAHLELIFVVCRRTHLCCVIDQKQIDIAHLELTAEWIVGIGNYQHVPVAEIAAADGELRKPGTGSKCQRRVRPGPISRQASRLADLRSDT